MKSVLYAAVGSNPTLPAILMFRFRLVGMAPDSDSGIGLVRDQETEPSLMLRVVSEAAYVRLRGWAVTTMLYEGKYNQV